MQFILTVHEKSSMVSRMMLHVEIWIYLIVLVTESIVGALQRLFELWCMSHII